MSLAIDIPPDVEAVLRAQLGSGLEQRAKQDLAVGWFREGRLTSRQVAVLLGISLFEAHAFLKRAGASLPVTIADVEADLTTLHELHGS